MNKHVKEKKLKSKFHVDEITLILIVAFLAIIVSVYDRSLSGKSNEPQVLEAEKITNMLLDGRGISFASNNIIDEKKVKALQNMDYSEIKKSMNAKNDFCIYIEDISGNVILAKGAHQLNGNGRCGG